MAFVDCAFETFGGSNGANKACGPSVQWDEYNFIGRVHEGARVVLRYECLTGRE